MTLLYLGLDPKKYPGALHYPVIRTVPLFGPERIQALALYPQCTHVLFTSQTTVRYWNLSLEDKIVVAIGAATAAALPKGVLVAKEATQEGMIALLKESAAPNSYFLYPHSRRSRPLLAQFLQEEKIPFFDFALYDTIFQAPEPIPDLTQIDEIVFTSPSTVEGFLRIYGSLPRDKILTPIGPITEKAINDYNAPLK